MVPMTLCGPDPSDRGKPALELERLTASLREQRLSVLLIGFPHIVRETFEKQLRDWFHCRLVVEHKDTPPDVVMLEEYKEELVQKLNRAARLFGTDAVLLSVAMAVDRRGKPRQRVQGFKALERIQYPVGPSSLGKALSVCVRMLQQLRKSGDNDKQEESEFKPEGPSQASRPNNQTVEEDHGYTLSREELQARSGPLIAATAQNSSVLERKKVTDVVSDASLPNSLESSHSKSTTEQLCTGSPDLAILVVEDNPVNRRLLGIFLKKHGCRSVTFAENGALAVQAVRARSTAFDVVFMGMSTMGLLHDGLLSLVSDHDNKRGSQADINLCTDLSMPVMNGFEATRNIRRIERERACAQASSDWSNNTYVVAVTGLASQQDEEEALAAGVDRFVTKPVQFGELTQLLKERIGRSSNVLAKP
jgi:CheY-like chemotaxis protein